MNRCISCGSLLLEDMVIIGDQYPSAIFVDDNTQLPEPSCLNLAKCSNQDCGLVQLVNKYNLDSVFEHYPYESGKTASMVSILQDVVEHAELRSPLMAGDVVLDIGGNDGTLLSLIDKPVTKVNIDAAHNMSQVLSGPNYYYKQAKFNATEYRALNLPNPKVIFSVAMFYHLNDPVSFCREVKEIMDEDTEWVLQMTYLGSMMRDNVLDNIVHEHAAYYSLKSLEFLLSQVGLYISEAEIVPSYGGSLRVFVERNKYKRSHTEVEDFERKNQTNSCESLSAFNTRVQLLKNSIKSIVEHLVEMYGPMDGFGASTKGNMLLQFLGLNKKHICRILDNSPKKIGKKTAGTMIPIMDEIEGLKSLSEYLFVLPYYYTDTFIPMIQTHLYKESMVCLLVPLPYPHFITVRGKP